MSIESRSDNPNIDQNPNAPEVTGAPIDADDIPNTMPYRDSERAEARRIQEQNQSRQASESSDVSYPDRVREKWRKDGKKVGKIALIAGGVTTAITAGAAIWVSNTLNQYSEPGSRGEPIDPVRPPMAEAPVVPGNPAPTAETPAPSMSPESDDLDNLTIIASYNESLRQPIREQRATLSDEEIAQDPSLWVYPPLQRTTNSTDHEIYGATLSEDLKITTGGVFTQYPEGGGATVAAQFKNIVEYGFQVPYEYNMFDYNSIDALPLDLRDYTEVPHTVVMDNLFSTGERNGELATYLDNWGLELLDARDEQSRSESGADTSLDLEIPSTESFTELALSDNNQQMFTIPMQFTKDFGADRGVASFEVVFEVAPEDIDGDGSNDRYIWTVVDSTRQS